ncbi:MAG TPA: DUF1501 domain-containing protein [Planctomycetaceae bacterium]|nr:DUF1501 domain-containing protein [Planctomycetaceae bacterium]
MRCDYACGTAEHVSRRSFLQGAAGALGALSFGGMTTARAAQELASAQKQVVVFWLAGGVSQLETWDPKPDTDTGGPFQPIETSVPGVQICELLPYTARQMHNLALIRGVNTAEDDHGKGAHIMLTGHRETPGFEYPYIGSAFAAQLSPENSPLPGYIHVAGGGSPREASFLGPRFAPVGLPDGGAPPNLALPKGLSAEQDARRRALRSKLSGRFVQGRRQAETEAYNASYDQAAALIARKDIFDFSSISDADQERYGKHPFGRHCLMARKLIENGVTFVKVTHSNYDTHSENFNFHIEQLGEFDQPFATFVGDLSDRGLLKNTLIIVMCEFGRTPRINHLVGRDHWSKAWSVAVGGAGIKGGAVVGKTNDNGTQVVDREVNGGHLFHTYYRAVGLDPTKAFWHEGRPFHKADPKTDAITEILA